ncbi:MAG: histidine ammonia-lyase [Planctomycetota bacterium]|jgi:histidine ammonia-lyase|nr:histidine ammonia-lyase [Planctomycetota bacterium]MDP6763664.1 histidine ammonia-lyase [Planctomycetota bacterium]MDP6987933.1 histidine ammonia-lyase [Planctomycetota bacterium]
MDTLNLDGRSLSLEQLQPLREGQPVGLVLGEDALAAVARARAVVEEHVRAGDVVYGLTTGFGKLKDVAIDAADLERLQRNLVLSHCCGSGDPMPVPEVRIAQVLRLNGLSRGHSGVRVELLEALVRLFEKGFVPEVPQKGSVGASGDLAPLAHMAAAYLGAGHARVGGERMSAADALAAVGEEPIVLQAKEGLALINGTEIMKATGVAAWLGAANLSRASDAICALTIEAMHGSLAPFDERLADLKGSAGHRRTAANVRRCLAGSGVLASHADCARVQDAYSLRCAPQVHGASKAAIEHVGDVLGAEINSVTDNPVLFPDSGEVVSAGQFHGQPVSMALDYLAIGVTTLANISERRIEQLVNPDLSGLPAFLTPDPGVNSGYMIAQVAAASLASENKVLAHPASADTIPTNANQEDHVSMGVTAARKAREIVENTERVLAIELLCAVQARDLRDELQAGPGAQTLHDLVRSAIPKLEADRYVHDDLELAGELLRSGAVVAAVEAAVGPLEA